jgi:hypothetical protein
MQPLLPEKESRNGTGAKMLVQAKYCAAAIPLGAAFRYPSDFDRYRQARTSGLSLHFRHHKPRSSVATALFLPYWSTVQRAPGLSEFASAGSPPAKQADGSTDRSSL